MELEVIRSNQYSHNFTEIFTENTGVPQMWGRGTSFPSACWEWRALWECRKTQRCQAAALCCQSTQYWRPHCTPDISVQGGRTEGQNLFRSHLVGPDHHAKTSVVILVTTNVTLVWKGTPKLVLFHQGFSWPREKFFSAPFLFFSQRSMWHIGDFKYSFFSLWKTYLLISICFVSSSPCTDNFC